MILHWLKPHEVRDQGSAHRDSGEGSVGVHKVKRALGHTQGPAVHIDVDDLGTAWRTPI